MFKKVYVEITNNCNLNCEFCIGNKRKKKFIELNEFNTILDKLKGFTKYLYFHIMGEPLLHPNINELIDIASKDYFVNITTNGYLINRIENNKNIRQVNISLHSFDEKYKKNFEEYISDVFNAVDKLKVVNTIICYRLWVDSKYSKNIIKKLEEKYKVSIGNNKEVKLDDRIYFQVEEEFIWPSLDNDYENTSGSCMGCRTHIGVLVDGTIVPCCLDSEGIINLGNIYKEDLNDIISGNLFKEIKKGFLENKKIHKLCQKCNFYDLRR